MFERLRAFLFGAPIAPGGTEGIPDEARKAHHRLRNTAMRVKQNARLIERDANDLIQSLARDIKRMGPEC